MMRFAYYPGCTAKGSTQEVDTATRWLAGKLDIELIELAEAGCCGSCEIKAVNPTLHLMLNARILALAEERGLEILTVCDTCQANLIQTARRLDSDSETRAIVFEKLGRAGVHLDKKPRARHLVRILADEIGWPGLRQRVTRPLTGLNVAGFSCCHVFRGSGSQPADKSLIDEIVAVSGATPRTLRSDGDCCGFHILMVNEELATRAAGRFLKKCAEAKVDCIVTTSPLCHAALDIYRRKAQTVGGRPIAIPVLHVEQLLALSFGCSPSSVGLERHMVSTDSLVKRIAA